MGLLPGQGSAPTAPAAGAAPARRVAETERGMLVERAQAGDRDAFEALLAPWLLRSLRAAFVILGNEADARDATQEAFLQAWDIPRLRDPDRFDAWLNRILVNRCRTLLGNRRRTTVREIHMSVLPESDEPASGEGHWAKVGRSARRRRARLPAAVRRGADDPRPSPPPAAAADGRRGRAGHPRGHGEVASVRRPQVPRAGSGGRAEMTTKKPLTDATIEAALARCAERISGDGLQDQIMAGVAQTSQSRPPLAVRLGLRPGPAAPAGLPDPIGARPAGMPDERRPLSQHIMPPATLNPVLRFAGPSRSRGCCWSAPSRPSSSAASCSAASPSEPSFRRRRSFPSRVRPRSPSMPRWRLPPGRSPGQRSRLRG